jgi:hypothetical protein
MPKFTVIGYYPDNNQPWATSAEGETWREAVEACTKDVAEGWSVRVCGVIEGDHLCVDDMDETLELSNDAVL